MFLFPKMYKRNEKILKNYKIVIKFILQSN